MCVFFAPGLSKDLIHTREILDTGLAPYIFYSERYYDADIQPSAIFTRSYLSRNYLRHCYDSSRTQIRLQTHAPHNIMGKSLIRAPMK